MSKCANGAHTMLAGKVYDPAGRVPLSNVLVFVPNDASKLPAIARGTTSTCDPCSEPVGDYASISITDNTGSFVMPDVPTGKNVPLVVQLGKWRRVLTVPNVVDCVTTTLPSTGDGQARLPRNRQEGDMPQMALLTGGLDDLGCFLRRVGIDAAEYSAPQEGGRLDIYQGLGTGGTGDTPGGRMTGPGLSSGTAGDCTTTSCPLWSSKKALENYDLVLLACEGDTFDPDARPDAGPLTESRVNVTRAGKQAMHDWLDEGGRVFATHFQYTWFQYGPADLHGAARWLSSSVGPGTCDCNIDTSFPRGQAFHDWLGAVGALTGDAIALTGVAKSVAAVNDAGLRWIYDGVDGDPKYLTIETPINSAPEVPCGRAVFSDVHAGGFPSGDVPGSCQMTELTPQEKALEFLFFDLASCLQPDSKPPNVSPPPTAR